MSSIYYIKQQIKHFTTSHKPSGQKNIFLFSTPRSGSTWLAELIATQPGFKIVNEPFNIRKQIVSEYLGINTWEGINDLRNAQKVYDYLNMFVQGKDRDWRFKREVPFSQFWNAVTDRILFKILFAGEQNPDWFKENFNGEVLFLLRHPASVSLSRTSLPRLESFLQAPYSDQFLDYQISFANQLYRNGSIFQLAVLDWCLQNIPLIRQVKPDWAVISYEQTVMEPEIVINYLVHKFQFPKPDRMFEQIHKASGSTVKSNSESKIVLQDPSQIMHKRKWLVEKWQEHISQDQIKQAMEILECFELTFYNMKDTLPSLQYWISNIDKSKLT